MSTRAVLFDYGHTLIDYAVPEAFLLDAYHRINGRLEQELECTVPGAADLFRTVSVRVDEAIGQSYLEGSEQEVDIAALYRGFLGDLGLRPAPGTITWVMEEEQRAWYQGVAAGPSVHQTLAALRARGLRLCIVSNAAFLPSMMRGQMRHLGLFDYFDATVFSSEVGLRKPHRAIYIEALRRLDLPAGECLFVGDRLREDVRGPGVVGIPALLTHEFRQELPAEDEKVRVIREIGEVLEAV
ncbi:MAG: HAD family hydrolase [Candidatus Dormibacteria bacterium]